MYGLSPSSSLVAGCVLKWPVLAPLAAVGITAYTLCAPPKEKPVEKSVPVVESVKQPEAPAPVEVKPVEAPPPPQAKEPLPVIKKLEKKPRG